MRFRNVLSNQPIHVFISASLPSGKRMSKIEVGFQSLGNQLVFRKFLSVVCCDGEHMIRNWLKQINNGLAHLVSRAIVYFSQQGKTRFPFCKSYYGLTMSFPNNRVHFPVPNPFASSYNGWTFFNTYPVRQLTSPFIAAVPLASLFLES